MPVFISSMILFFFFSFSVFMGQNLPTKQTSVAGFINYGDASDDDINIVMTKSLTIYLSKIPGFSITPYEEIEKAASENGYWRLKKIDPETAIQIAQKANSKLVITGFYQTDKKNKVIEIHVFVYDVVTGDLKLSRLYKGPTDIGLFDTIDRMEKNISGLLYGREFDFARLSVKAQGTDKIYFIYVDGKKSGILSVTNNYEDQFATGYNLELSLRLAGSLKEVFRKSLTLSKNKISEIIYRPAGIVNVKSFIYNVNVSLDGTNRGCVNDEGLLTLDNVGADSIHLISIQTNGIVTASHEVSVDEGGSSIVVFERDKNNSYFYGSGSIFNPGISPYYDLLLPGIVQIECNDPVMGYIFLGTDVLAIGTSVLSLINYESSYQSYINATNPSDQQNYINSCLTWRYIFFGSVAIWAIDTALSTLNAAFIPGKAYIEIKADAICLEYRLYF